MTSKKNIEKSGYLNENMDYSDAIADLSFELFKHQNKLNIINPHIELETLEITKKEGKNLFFEKWEKSTADKIREIYKNNGIDLYTYGNAQKWINMTIKYIFSSNYMNHNVDIYEVAYLPIDSIIQQIAYKELGVKKLSCAWSKCDDWEEIERYQNDIQKAILTNTKYKSRLWWECNAWKV